jgi:Fur family transcriptional regulator, peroxide stress response regulator
VQKSHKKYRRSYEREKILDILCSTKIHPTADWIHKKLQDKNIAISIATVYRNLSILCDQGLAIKLDLQGDGDARYDGNMLPHNHFVCKKHHYILDSQTKSDAGIDQYIVCSKCL